MANRNPFNKYSTIAEKLAYLQKKQLESETANFNTTGLSQGVNYSESYNIENISINQFSTTPAFICDCISQSSGYTSSLLVDNAYDIGVGSKIWVDNNITVTNDNGLFIVTADNLQPVYQIGNIILTKCGDRYFSDGELADGDYTAQSFTIVADVIGNTIKLLSELYFNLGEVVFSFGNNLYT